PVDKNSPPIFRRGRFVNSFDMYGYLVLFVHLLFTGAVEHRKSYPPFINDALHWRLLLSRPEK
ncbi:hypothetical protein, partial [Shouchella clausii]|uniref:hypothetical protein n=1 Tax=Shouchella clausii TaxID=79880 RepID=UPI00280C3B94